MRTPEQEIRILKERLALLESVVLGGKSYIPGQAEYDRAIEALARGDVGPLDRYTKAGGIVPDVPEPTRRGRRQGYISAAGSQP